MWIDRWLLLLNGDGVLDSRARVHHRRGRILNQLRKRPGVSVRALSILVRVQILRMLRVMDVCQVLCGLWLPLFVLNDGLLLDMCELLSSSLRRMLRRQVWRRVLRRHVLMRRVVQRLVLRGVLRRQVLGYLLRLGSAFILLKLGTVL